MRINDLIQLGKSYLSLGIIIALLIVIIFLFIYKKCTKKKNIDIKRVIWMVFFFSYMVMIVSVTLLDRGKFFREHNFIPFLYSYKDAWIHASAQAWRNIILNILAFVPFGILLPAGFRKLDCFWKVYLTGFLFTAFIECTQFLSECGIFEVDDLINNTLGTVIGYGIYVLFVHFLSYIRKTQDQKYSWKKTILLQIPLLASILIFAGIYRTYVTKELGNVSIRNIGVYKEGNIDIKSDLEFEEEKMMWPVYKCKVYSKEEAIKSAEKIFENLGVSFDEKEADFYQDEALFRADERYHLWFSCKGGGYSLTDFEAGECEEKEVEEKEIKEALSAYNIEVPDYMEMEWNEEGDFSFTSTMKEDEKSVTDGFIRGRYCGNGMFCDISYNLVKYDLYKDFQIISPKEAYDQLCEGRFNWYESGNLYIEMKDYKIKYIQDTKGFYQPYYSFRCFVNGEEKEIAIAGIQ